MGLTEKQITDTVENAMLLTGVLGLLTLGGFVLFQIKSCQMSLNEGSLEASEKKTLQYLEFAAECKAHCETGESYEVNLNNTVRCTCGEPAINPCVLRAGSEE